jgi:3D (Asp-Asp-Asp) domain-containing protein
MNTQLLVKAVAIITLPLFLQACGALSASNTVKPDEDELGELISSIEAQKLQEDAELTGTGNLRTMKVTASAYNSLPGQTDSRPNEAAWGDTLKPGMKAIAVSRDLLGMGLTRNTRVKIKGMPGTYRVLDKMNRRWSRKIDIYMGNDRRKAIQWGRRSVEISWYDGK